MLASGQPALDLHSPRTPLHGAPPARSRRWLWRAARAEPWSPATHARFPPAFSAAVQCLLLAAHRGTQALSLRQPGVRVTRSKRQASALLRGSGQGQEAGAVLLALLGPELLASIIGLAAYPLSVWRPRTVERQHLPPGYLRWTKSAEWCF